MTEGGPASRPVQPGRPGPWQAATVVAIRPETASARTIRLRLGGPVTFLPGQHFVVRLTAPDGYSAQRSYSASSAPDGSPELELTVERLPDGEVSTFLCDDLREGDAVELRGPIGGWFAWDGTASALLIGGGSGVVPLMSMLRHARRTGREDLLRLVVSVRAPEDLYYRDELRAAGPVHVVYSRRTPAGHPRPPGRLTASDLAGPGGAPSRVYICGSAPFAEAATAAVLGAGFDAGSIRVERFGPTG